MPSPGTSTSAPKPADNSGCLIPFGALFAIVGIAVGMSALFQGPVRARDTGLRLMMAVIFGLTGSIVFFWGIAGRRTSRQVGEMARQHPNEPWLWRADWAQGTAEPESKSQFLTYALMGVIFVLVSMPALLNLNREVIKQRHYGNLIALIFPLAGLYLIGHALLERFRTQKFGAIFRMAQTPGVAGGHLRGRIETRVALPPDQPVDLTLSCVRATTSGRNRWEDVFWQDKARATPILGPLGSTITVDFEIPYDAAETDTRDPREQVYWRLAAARKGPGVDFKTSFQVPVFKTSASDAALTTQKIEDEALANASPAQPAGSKIRVGQAPEGGVQYYLGPARSKGMAAAMMAFGLAFGAFGFFFSFATNKSFGWFLGAIPLVFAGGIGLLLLIFSVSLWLSTTTIRIANGELHIKSAFLGIARSKTIRAADIQEFELYPGMRSGNQIWYDLRVHLRGGGKVTAGSGLEKREAEWLEREINRNLGLRSA